MDNKDEELLEGLDLDGIDLDGDTKEENSEEEAIIEEIKLDDSGDMPNVQVQDEKEQSEVQETDDLNSLMEQIETTTKKKKKQQKQEKDKKKQEKEKAKEEAKKYKGPRHIKVYGEELWTEENPDVTNEQIRQRIVDEFGFKEFTADKTLFDLDESTGILDIGKQFKKKG